MKNMVFMTLSGAVVEYYPSDISDESWSEIGQFYWETSISESPTCSRMTLDVIYDDFIDFHKIIF